MELRQKCDERTDGRTMHGASLEESLYLLLARNAIHFSDDDLMCNATEKQVAGMTNGGGGTL